MAKKLSTDTIAAIENQIRGESIPYNYNTKEYPVEVIVNKFDRDEIFVPHYQRNFVWDANRKSRFIESVFLGVPIMPLLVSVSGEEAELEIIDGSQRVRTLVDYLKDRFKLKGLKKLTELNGTVYSQLPNNVKNQFKLRDFRFHVVTDKASPETRADIFDRVNTSSKSLSPSEIRKGALQGTFYDFVMSCARSELLRKLCPIPAPKAARGEYEELVLRFFAYSDKYREFKHDVAPFLDEYVKRQNKQPEEHEQKRQELNAVLNFVDRYFEPPYFARRGRDNATPRVRFEALAVGINLAMRIEPNLEPTYMNWLESNEFKELTTSDASNNQGKLINRIEFVRDCLLNIKTQAELSYE